MWSQESKSHGVGEAGISTYKDVIVFWDSDFDNRVIRFIDNLPASVKNQLVAIHEREARLWLWWKDAVPFSFTEGEPVEFEGDLWRIERSEKSGTLSVQTRTARHSIN